MNLRRPERLGPRRKGVPTQLRLPALVTTITLMAATPSSASAHSEHAAVAPGIIDPLVTHHAVLEDELKLNYEAVRRGEDGAKRHLGSLELAVALADAWGVEVFLPFGAVVGPTATTRGLGDLEVQIPKWSPVRRHGFVLTTYTAVRIPTATEDTDVGELGWTVAPHVLTDLGFGRWGLQLNGAAEFETAGHVALEGKGSLAWSHFLNDAQTLRVSPLAEIAVEAPLGEEGEAPEFLLTAGVKIGYRGWHLGLGTQPPVTDASEEANWLIAQLGYHVTWADLFGGGVTGD